MDHDLVIRSGTVLDGSGGAPYRADVGIDNGRITTIGRIRSRGRAEIDAEGRYVSPGFIEGHTHMDAQMHWDHLGASSSLHGVTTAVMGNCGFTLAPCKRGEQDYVFRSLERAEEIPRESMLAGIDWDWETFEQYLDAIDRLPMGINYAVYIGHSALRTYVMGERAFEEGGATEADLEAMRRELATAVRAGAIGFSTTRSPSHMTSDGRPVPSRQATWDEVRALVGVMGDLGAGLFELDSEKHEPGPGREEYLARVQALAIESGRPIFSMLVVPPREPEFWRDRLAFFDAVAAAGGRAYGQVHVGQLLDLYGFKTHLPFDKLPLWSKFRALPLEEQHRRLLDPAERKLLVEEATARDEGALTIGNSVRLFRYDTTTVVDAPYGPYRTIAEVAAERGTTPVDLLIDLSLESNFDQLFGQRSQNLDLGPVLEILRHPRTVIAASDAGAHVQRISAASIPTQFLAYWVRQREAFSWPQAIRMLTGVPAGLFGFGDRGLLVEGYRADVVVFDPATVGPEMATVEWDFPAGARRLKQRARGIAATVVNGEVLLRDGKHTGAEPGRLLRGPLADVLLSA